ncbi:unnamed protein product [Durusdinium trenchii]|uniref:Uncharacterized protein n=1 Tax=Durusdinium trenchii TaxID=1381693 RepID=A0ABP0MWP6_9DINO
MPLALVWGYTAYVSPGKVPWQISTLLGVTCACCAVTCAICLRWGIRDGRKSAFIVVTENRPMVPIYLELVRTIVMVPAIMSLMAVLCILRPSTSFTLQLLMAIFTCVVVGNMTRYFVALLGEPPMPQELLARVPKKRWWCGSCCGGVNDTCWGLGSAWSKVPHRVTLSDLHTGISMVRIFMILHICLQCFSLSASMVPMSVQMLPTGYCEAKTMFSSPWILWFVIVMTVSASYVGMAGFAVINNAISSVLDVELRAADEAAEDEEQKFIRHFQVASQSKSIPIYMLLPLVGAIMGAFPVRFRDVTITINSHNDKFHCPVFDQNVCGHLLYSMCIALGMMWVSVLNYRSFTPAGMPIDKLPEVLAQLAPASPADSDSDDPSNEGSGSLVSE